MLEPVNGALLCAHLAPNEHQRLVGNYFPDGLIPHCNVVETPWSAIFVLCGEVEATAASQTHLVCHLDHSRGTVDLGRLHLLHHHVQHCVVQFITQNIPSPVSRARLWSFVCALEHMQLLFFFTLAHIFKISFLSWIACTILVVSGSCPFVVVVVVLLLILSMPSPALPASFAFDSWCRFTRCLYSGPAAISRNIRCRQSLGWCLPMRPG